MDDGAIRDRLLERCARTSALSPFAKSVSARTASSRRGGRDAGSRGNSVRQPSSRNNRGGPSVMLSRCLDPCSSTRGR